MNGFPFMGQPFCMAAQIEAPAGRRPVSLWSRLALFEIARTAAPGIDLHRRYRLTAFDII